MIGRPKYKRGDIVEFVYDKNNENITVAGRVEIVDSYGTFDQNMEPSYDILAPDIRDNSENCLYKHVQESKVKLLKKERIQ